MRGSRTDDSILTTRMMRINLFIPAFPCNPDLQPRDTGDVIIEPFGSQSARLRELPIPNGNPAFIGTLGSF